MANAEVEGPLSLLFSLSPLLFLFCSTMDWSQGLAHTRQALYTELYPQLVNFIVFVALGTETRDTPPLSYTPSPAVAIKITNLHAYFSEMGSRLIKYVTIISMV